MKPQKRFKDEKERKRIMDRINKILNHAKGTSYEAEAETAMKMAQSYMKQYGLSMNDVEVEAYLKDEEIVQDFATEVSRMYAGEDMIASICTIIFDVKAIFSRRNGKRAIAYIGYTEDVNMAKMVHVTLLVSLRLESAKRYPGPRTYVSRKSFTRGVCNKLRQRAKEEKQTDTKDTTKGYGLIVVGKSTRISNWINERINLKQTKQRGGFDEAAYQEGQEHAKNIDLHNKRKVTADSNRLTYSGGK